MSAPDESLGESLIAREFQSFCRALGPELGRCCPGAMTGGHGLRE